MKRLQLENACRLGSVALLAIAPHTANAGLTILGGLPSGSHVGNLVTNGSFEIGAPANGFANAVYWANPAGVPYAVPPTWASTGAGSTAHWGNDSGTPYRLRSSDLLPDGRAAVDFQTSRNTTVSQPPTFNPDGTVTFPAPPVFTTATGGPPVTLRQTVNTQLTPAPSYYLSFWVSGEENATVQGNTGAGILGMRLTNVLPGDPIQWLAVPNGLAYGLSHVYQYSFTPLNTSLPVEVRFISWGGMDLSAYGMSPFCTQPILDDVIINAAPEPASAALLALGGVWCLRRRRRTASTLHLA